jgi:tetratricopeptide (TPR) repeat protein
MRTPGVRIWVSPQCASGLALAVAMSFAVAVVLIMILPARARADVLRERIDEDDVAALRAGNPHALELVEKGEALALAGDVAGAAELFRDATTHAPRSALSARRLCEALTALGRRDEAIAACDRAIASPGSALDMRAMVRALMSGPEAPTPADVATAMTLMRKAQTDMPLAPWGYAAACDIAQRLGDRNMLEDCLHQLQRWAPDHYETTRALAAASALRPSWRTWLGWLAIAALCMGTLVHALWLAIARQRVRARAVATVAGLFVLLALPGRARAQAVSAGAPSGADRPFIGMSKWPVDDSNPESSIPDVTKRNRDPLEFGYWLMDLTEKAERAAKRGDHQTALKEYGVMAKLVPDRSIPYAKMCDSYEALGDRAKAIDSCATALTLTGVTVNDYVRYVHLVLAKKGTLDAKEVADVTAVIDHMRTDPAGGAAADEVDCELGVRIADTPRLQGCTAALAARAPDDPKTISFQWALALQEGEYAQAKRLVERAKATPMAPAGIQQMAQATATAESSHQWRVVVWTVALLLLAAAAVAAGFVAWRRSDVSTA